MTYSSTLSSGSSLTSIFTLSTTTLTTSASDSDYVGTYTIKYIATTSSLSVTEYTTFTITITACTVSVTTDLSTPFAYFIGSDAT